MLIAIGILAVVVVYLASKPMPGDPGVSGNGLPPPSPIPSTGTSGVPSPATHPGFGNAILGTNLGQLTMGTNGGLPVQSVPPAMSAPVPLPAPGVVSSAPLGPPSQAASLPTQQSTASLQAINAGYHTGMKQL
jgi:hypothetical protein